MEEEAESIRKNIILCTFFTSSVFLFCVNLYAMHFNVSNLIICNVIGGIIFLFGICACCLPPTPPPPPDPVETTAEFIV
jgi:uncharacterized membrane protein YgdD (TMEM256/DUF423 family)